MEYVILVKTEDGKEARVHTNGQDSQEAFENARRMYPTWQTLFLEKSWDPNESLSTLDLDLYDEGE